MLLLWRVDLLKGSEGGGSKLLLNVPSTGAAALSLILHDSVVARLRLEASLVLVSCNRTVSRMLFAVPVGESFRINPVMVMILERRS